MLAALIRMVCVTIVRFFYRQIAVRGRENIPADVPVLVVANHPNGLLDAVAIRIALGREVGFMAKATLFENFVGKTALDAFGSVPVFRAKDGKDTSANERTFEAVRERFRQGRWVLIFPEGHSHSEPALTRLKTGAARIVLSAEEEADFDLDLKVLPVGLVYEDKERFRSRLAVVVGRPMSVADYRERYEADEWETARELTTDIASALADVMLEAETTEVWRGFLAVARWTSTEAVSDVAAAEARAHRLAEGYRALMERDPDAAEEIANRARRFVNLLDAIGVHNPFDLERPNPPTLPALTRNAAWYVSLAFPAVVGWVLNALPYYVIRPIAVKFAGEDTDIISNVKALAGLLFYPLTWVIEAILAWQLVGIWWGVAALCAGPLAGVAAVHFFERIELRRDVLVGTWLRFTRASVLEAVQRQRKELTALVEQSLSDLETT